ncbi:MAG: hotdog fold thioesterase [Bacteroidetes bacterium]|nr:hotdog fold thioesterase [Bacteroidota bacterium]
MDQNLLEDWANRTLLGALGIEMLLMTEERVEAKMPVDARTHQPYGILHGGASAALAETVASVGSYLIAKKDNSIAVGVDLNITHLKSKRHGWVTGIATPIKLGKNLHVWNIDILDEDGSMIAKAKLTTMVKPAK